MATITPVAVNAAGASLTLAAASGGGDTIATGGLTRVVFVVRNASGSSINATFAGVVPCSAGSLHNVVVPCPAGQDTDITVPSQCISPTTGNAGVTYSAVTSVTVGAITN